MGNEEILTINLIFRWDETTQQLFVLDANPNHPGRTIAQINYATLDKMSWAEASKFIGEFVTLLVPKLRSRYMSEFADDV